MFSTGTGATFATAAFATAEKSGDDQSEKLDADETDDDHDFYGIHRDLGGIDPGVLRDSMTVWLAGLSGAVIENLLIGARPSRSVGVMARGEYVIPMTSVSSYSRWQRQQS